MKKWWLLFALVCLLLSISCVSLAYLTDNNTISLAVYALIGLSGFCLSVSNFILQNVLRNKLAILFFSLGIFISTVISFHNQSWLELSWNFNVAGHLLMCCLALLATINDYQNLLAKILKVLFVCTSIILILAIIFKLSNPLIYSTLSVLILVTTLGISLIHLLSPKNV